MTDPVYTPFHEYAGYTPQRMRARARAFYAMLARRRTVREFSDRPVPRDIIETCLRAAGTAPSGANRQPWHFAVIEPGPLRTRLRLAAEKEERAFYESRAGADWLEALKPLGTEASKPFLETAPWVIAIFGQRSATAPDGRALKNYYVPESVSIAAAFLINALHFSGLATLTHTPSPMAFLTEICGRPAVEKPYLLLVTGYPAPDARIPDAARCKKPLHEIASFLK